MFPGKRTYINIRQREKEEKKENINRKVEAIN